MDDVIDHTAELKQAYEIGLESLTRLADRFGISLYALRKLANREGWRRQGHMRRDADGRPMSWLNKPCPGLGDCPERSQIVAQSWLLAQTQIDEIEMQFSDLDDASQRKRTSPISQARALGVMVRVLKDLVALDRAARHDSSQDEGKGGLDPDGLRDELARRLAAIQKGRDADETPRGA